MHTMHCVVVVLDVLIYTTNKVSAQCTVWLWYWTRAVSCCVVTLFRLFQAIAFPVLLFLTLLQLRDLFLLTLQNSR